MSGLDRVLLREVLEKLDQVLELLRAEPAEKYIVIDGELRRLVDDAPPGAIPLTPEAGIFNLVGCADELSLGEIGDKISPRQIERNRQFMQASTVIPFPTVIPAFILHTNYPTTTDVK